MTGQIRKQIYKKGRETVTSADWEVGIVAVKDDDSPPCDFTLTPYPHQSPSLLSSHSFESSDSMEDRKHERNGSWLSVPQFGDWDQKAGVPDYSLDFSKIRENRKQHKRDPSRASLGNEEEFINPTAPVNVAPPSTSHHFVPGNSQPTRRGFLSYFNCCVKA